MSTQTKHIENVFDPQHHVTDKEWEGISLISKEQYLSALTEDSANKELAILYCVRGNMKLMKKYLNRLSKDLRFEVSQGLYDYIDTLKYQIHSI